MLVALGVALLFRGSVAPAQLTATGGQAERSKLASARVEATGPAHHAAEQRTHVVTTPAPSPIESPPIAAPSSAPRNLLVLGSFRIPVVAYVDCSGVAPLPADKAALDSCFAGRRYFVAHNPGPFHPLMGMGIGAQISWFDGSGVLHRYRVVTVRLMRRNDGPVTLSREDVTAQFQTCETADASWVRLLDAVSE